MYKKLITACMAIAAFAAFVVPSTASATNDPQLTESGSAVAVGSKIVGTNVGDTLFTNTGGGTVLVRCSNAKMTGEVAKNSGGNVEGTIETSDFWGTGSTSAHNNLPECTGSFGNAYITVTGHLCIRSTTNMATDEFQVSSSTGTCSGLGNVQFVIGSTTVGACEYETTTAVVGHGTTGANTRLTVTPNSNESGATKISGSFFCPSSGALSMTFALETENGTEITIS